jgi:hypothetical protein
MEKLEGEFAQAVKNVTVNGDKRDCGLSSQARPFGTSAPTERSN